MTTREPEVMLQKLIYAQYRRPTGWLGRWIGQRMAQQHVPENEWTVQVLDAQPGDHILEIGFGPGLAIEKLLRQVPDVQIAGIDYSQTMVHAARRRNARAVRAGRVDLRYGDVQHLPFADTLFERVYSIHCIYFWPDAEKALAEIQRVMKPGGRLVITFLPVEQPEAGSTSFMPYTCAEVEALLAKVGFVQPQRMADPLKRSPSSFSLVASRYPDYI
jgi:ubiquinone/menaquinone biosynthesis C-methylase UbiE